MLMPAATVLCGCVYTARFYLFSTCVLYELSNAVSRIDCAI